MIILDSNVVSELMRVAPSPVVAAWVRSHGAAELSTTSITLAEIRYGIDRLPDGRRKDVLRTTADDVFSAFSDQVLSFDASAAVEYAAIVSHRDRIGMPMNGFDAQIASICRAREATLATRNVKDFENAGIDIIDPWRHSA
ncbi:MAG: type II toxin-antitoxin system VapC family toxin [Acidimicrobiales bacterium]